MPVEIYYLSISNLQLPVILIITVFQFGACDLESDYVPLNIVSCTIVPCRYKSLQISAYTPVKRMLFTLLKNKKNVKCKISSLELPSMT